MLQGKDSVYDTDLFAKSMQVIERYSGKNLKGGGEERRFRIIADHARTAFMLVNDGLIPSNVGAGYVLRMIIRRMVYNMMLLGEISLEKYADFLREMLASFQGLREFKEAEIIRVLMEEIKLFQKTIQNGMQILNAIIKECKGAVLPGQEVFKLYDTYGFPMELTKEIASEQ